MKGEKHLKILLNFTRKFFAYSLPITFIDKGKKISSSWDSLIVVDNSTDNTAINNYFDELRVLDKCFDKEVSCLKVPNVDQKVIYSGVNEITDYDDVRCFFNAAAKGVERAISSGAKAPVVILPQNSMEHATLATILGIFYEFFS